MNPTAAQIESLLLNVGAIDVLNERIAAHAAGMPHADHPNELSQRELSAHTTAIDALLTAMSTSLERLDSAIARYLGN